LIQNRPPALYIDLQLEKGEKKRKEEQSVGENQRKTDAEHSRMWFRGVGMSEKGREKRLFWLPEKLLGRAGEERTAGKTTKGRETKNGRNKGRHPCP